MLWESNIRFNLKSPPVFEGCCGFGLRLSEPLVDPISAPDPQMGPIWLLLGRDRGQKVLDVSAQQVRVAGGGNSSKAKLYSQALLGF